MWPVHPIWRQKVLRICETVLLVKMRSNSKFFLWWILLIVQGCNRQQCKSKLNSFADEPVGRGAIWTCTADVVTINMFQDWTSIYIHIADFYMLFLTLNHQMDFSSYLREFCIVQGLLLSCLRWLHSVQCLGIVQWVPISQGVLFCTPQYTAVAGQRYGLNEGVSRKSAPAWHLKYEIISKLTWVWYCDCLQDRLYSSQHLNLVSFRKSLSFPAPI